MNEKMNPTNYFEYMKQLEATERQARDLKRKLRFQESKRTLELLKSMKAGVAHDLERIEGSCGYIKQNHTKLTEVLTSKSKQYINMDRECKQHVKDIVADISEIFGSSEHLSQEFGFDDRAIREFIREKTEERNEARQTHNNCLSLVSNVEQLMGAGDADNNKITAPNDIISSNKLRRKGSLILSESSFLNTFLPNNVSASSPISIHSKSSVIEEKENLK